MLGGKSTLLPRLDRSRPSRGRAEGGTAIGRFQLVFRREGKPADEVLAANDFSAAALSFATRRVPSPGPHGGRAARTHFVRKED
jgi:hypothetical protein